MSRDAVIEATSKLPFAGQAGIKAAYMAGREAAKEGRFGKRAASIAFLGTWATAHAFQAFLGVDVGLHHAQHGGALQDVEAGYDGLYTAANVAATYTQLRLAGKLAVMRARSGNMEAEMSGDGSIAVQSGAQPENATAEPFDCSNLSLAITIGGQALFFATALIR